MLPGSQSCSWTGCGRARGSLTGSLWHNGAGNLTVAGSMPQVLLKEYKFELGTAPTANVVVFLGLFFFFEL